MSIALPHRRWLTCGCPTDKAAEQAARIAGVLQIIDDVNATVVQADAMVRACELADWYLQEAARLAIEAAIPTELRDAHTRLGWIRDHGIETVTAAFLQKHGPGPLRIKARLDPREGCQDDRISN
jgi:hypothetical protein